MHWRCWIGRRSLRSSAYLEMYMGGNGRGKVTKCNCLVIYDRDNEGDRRMHRAWPSPLIQVNLHAQYHRSELICHHQIRKGKRSRRKRGSNNHTAPHWPNRVTMGDFLCGLPQLRTPNLAPSGCCACRCDLPKVHELRNEHRTGTISMSTWRGLIDAGILLKSH